MEIVKGIMPVSLEVVIQKEFKDFSLSVEFTHQNGILGVLGASGCGKTITLQSIAGLVTPKSGRIVLNDTVLFDSSRRINLKPQQRRVGYLFQNYALFPHMTVEQNIACALPGKSKKEKQSCINHLLSRFQLEGMHKRYPAQLSGGQQQRVALARIFAYEPELLLLDEPFSALDEHLKENLQMEFIEMLQGYPGQIVMVTHSREEVYRFCEKLAVMENGRVVEAGGTKRMFASPEYLSTAKLTGCKNISPAKKTGDRQVYALNWGIHLQTGCDVKEDIAYVGIRAHEFLPCSSPYDAPNCFKVDLKKQVEAPFEWNILFGPQDGKEPPMQNLWWKVGKKSPIVPAISHLQVPPEKVLLLKE